MPEHSIYPFRRLKHRKQETERGKSTKHIATFTEIESATRAQGLEPRGALRLSPDDLGLEQGLEGDAAWLLLLGAIGGSVWPQFSTSPEADDGQAHALDRWSERVVTALAEHLGAKPFFSFGDPPYLPFLRWAQQAEGLAPSPLGMLIHPDHGLWHSYRGALLFCQAPDDWQPAAPRPAPCRDCAERPCLSACPVTAFTSAGYDVTACRTHLASPAGEPCMSGGCLARRACPVAPTLAYDPAQMHFHMRAFLRSDVTG